MPEITQTMETKTAGADDLQIQLAGKYLTFKLGNEEYGLEILKVHQIIQMQEVTSVPRTPDFVRGVINLRGKIIPVIDLRRKFAMAQKDDTEKTCIIVVQIMQETNDVTMGIVIDEVKEVLEIKPDDIEEAPHFCGDISTEFILGIGKVGKHVKMLIDIDRILTLHELSSITQMTK